MANKRTFFFVTNINDGTCISRLRPYMEEVLEILRWEVDTNHPKKILTIETEADKDNVIPRITQVVEEAGFDIHVLEH